MYNVLICSVDIKNDNHLTYKDYNLIIKDNINDILMKISIDILVIDYLDPCLDFIIKIKLIRKYNPLIKIIVAINIIEESLIRLLYDNGIDYILIRPLEINILFLVFNKIFNINVLEDKIINNNENIIDKIIRILSKLGMPANLKGYKYIKEALVLCLNDYDYYLHTTSKLYPKLAKTYNTKNSCIEKAIRNAIELSWCRGDINKQDEIFGYTIDRNKGRPTNGEFLAQIVNYLSTI